MRQTETAGGRWAWMIGGSALVAYGIRRRSPAGVGMALVGGDLLYRGATGCHLYQQAMVPQEMHVERTVTIDKPQEELYRFCRNLENLPQILPYVKSVRPAGDKSFHWEIAAPAGRKLDLDCEITQEREGELLAWRSREGSPLHYASAIQFRRARGGRGTEVKVSARYELPGGKITAAIASLFGMEPEQQIREGLRRFRQLMEAGEIATTEGQPSGRKRTREEMAGRRKPIARATERFVTEMPSWAKRREA